MITIPITNYEAATKATRRIIGLTDAEPKMPYEIHASLTEEIGELAAVVKAEEGIVKHKNHVEDSLGECVDVWVCGLMMYGYVGGKWYEIVYDRPAIFPEPEKDKSKIKDFSFEVITMMAVLSGRMGLPLFKINEAPNTAKKMAQEYDMPLVDILKYLPKNPQIKEANDEVERHGLKISNLAFDLFRQRGGTEDQFWNIVDKKLDKWEKNLEERQQKDVT